MIKIGVDGRNFEKPVAGVARYVIQVLNIINISLERECFFYIYTQKEDISIEGAEFNFELRKDISILPKMKSLLWLKLFSFLLWKNDKLDYFVGGACFLPLFLASNIKKIVVIHDYNHLLARDTMTLFQKISHGLFYKNDVSKADFIIANSKGTYEKCRKYFDITPDLIINPKPLSIFKPLGKTIVSDRLKKNGINFPYILSVGTLEPRKNLDKVIMSFLELRAEGQFLNYKLVLAGKLGWKFSYIKSLIESNSDSIKHLGYVTDELLPYLYNGSSVFLFPSIYEGFGIPVAEAIACGSRIITTKIDELIEASQGQGEYLDSPDVKSIKKSLMQVLNTKDVINIVYKDNDLIKEINVLKSFLSNRSKLF